MNVHPNRTQELHRGLSGPSKEPAIALRDFVDVEKWQRARLTLAVRATVIWSVLVREWSAYLNTKIGDCTVASAANGKKIACAAAGEEDVVTDMDVLRVYEHSGYKPVNPDEPETNETDQGWTLEAVESVMQTIGFLGTEETPKPDIVTSVRVDLHDEEATQTACELAGGVHLAAELPQTAETQFRDGRAWTYERNTPGNEPGSWGGHGLWQVDSDLNGFDKYETWGVLQPVGPDWRAAYVVEKRALIWVDWEKKLPEEVRELGVVDFSKLESLVAGVEH